MQSMFNGANALSAANKLLIRCAWAGNSEFDSRLASGQIGSSWTSLGACSPAPPPAPPAPPYAPGLAPRPPPPPPPLSPQCEALRLQGVTTGVHTLSPFG